MPGQSSIRRWQGEVALAVATVLLLLWGGSTADAATVEPHATEAVNEVRPEFISFGIDASQLTERNSGQPFDFTRPALRKLAEELAPAFIRYSGTKIETTYYDDTNTLPYNGAPAAYSAKPGDRFVLSRDEWVAALEFADRAGLKVISSTSAGPGPRRMDGTWDPTNARSLFERAITEGHPPPVVMLGNEPNITYYGSGLPNTYTAADYARDVNDFLVLKEELLPGSTFVGPGPFFTTGAERPLYGGLLGPDVSDIMAATGDRYDIVSYHQYPAFGDSTKCEKLTPRLPADTLSDSFLDTPKGAYEYMASLRDRDAPGKPLWVDETGNTACGGVPGYSDKFISSFYFLNSLGYLARQGVEVVTRWTLAGGQPYTLIDDQTLQPRVDYWAAVLWRRLMGQTVLEPEVIEPDPEVRIYSQCLPGTVGGVTTLMLNTSRTDAKTVGITGGGGESARQYVVTGALDGGQVNLNGSLLEAGPDGSLPAMNGVPVRNGAVTVPAASYAFVTVPDARSEGCGSPHVNVRSKVTVTAPKQSLRRIRRTGRIRTFCRPDMASTCSLTATLPGRQARRLGLRPSRVTKKLLVATGKREISAVGRRAITLRVKGAVLKKLRQAPARFHTLITIRAVASGDGIDLPGTDTVRLRLKR